MNTIQPRPIRRQYGTGWITESWELFCASGAGWVFGTILGWWPIFIGSFAIQFFLQSSLPSLTGPHPTLPTSPREIAYLIPIGAFYLFELVYGPFITAGAYRMGVKAMRREPVRARDIFFGGPVFLPFIGYYLLTSIAMTLIISVFAGLAVLSWVLHANIVVSVLVTTIAIVVVVLALVFWTFILMGLVLVSDRIPITETLSRVFTIMRPHYGSVLGAAAIMFLLYLAGSCFCVGIVITLPMWFIMQALVGRDTLGLAAPADMPADWAPPGGLTQPGAWPPPPSQLPPDDLPRL